MENSEVNDGSASPPRYVMEEGEIYEPPGLRSTAPAFMPSSLDVDTPLPESSGGIWQGFALSRQPAPEFSFGLDPRLSTPVGTNKEFPTLHEANLLSSSTRKYAKPLQRASVATGQRGAVPPEPQAPSVVQRDVVQDEATAPKIAVRRTREVAPPAARPRKDQPVPPVEQGTRTAGKPAERRSGASAKTAPQKAPARATTQSRAAPVTGPTPRQRSSTVSSGSESSSSEVVPPDPVRPEHHCRTRRQRRNCPICSRGSQPPSRPGSPRVPVERAGRPNVPLVGLIAPAGPATAQGESPRNNHWRNIAEGIPVPVNDRSREEEYCKKRHYTYQPAQGLGFNPHGIGAINRRKACLFALGVLADCGCTNVDDVYGNERTTKLAAQFPANFPLDVNVVGPCHAAADVIRRPDAPVHFPTEHADGALFVNVYATSTSPFNPRWLAGFLEPRIKLAVLVTHKFPDACGTIDQDGAYYYNSGSTVIYQPSPDDMQYGPHDACTWNLSDGAAHGVCWTTVRSYGDCHVILVKRAPDEMLPYRDCGRHPLVSVRTINLPVLRGWSYFVHKCIPSIVPTAWRTALGERRHDAVVDKRLKEHVMQLMRGTKINAYSYKTCMNHLGRMVEAPPYSKVIEIFPEFQSQLINGAVWAAIIEVANTESLTLLAFNSEHGEAAAKRTNALNSMGTYVSQSWDLPWNVLLGLGTVVALSLGGYLGARLSALKRPSLQLPTASGAMAFLLNLNKFYEPVALTFMHALWLLNSLIEEGARYLMLPVLGVGPTALAFVAWDTIMCGIPRHGLVKGIRHELPYAPMRFVLHHAFGLFQQVTGFKYAVFAHTAYNVGVQLAAHDTSALTCETIVETERLAAQARRLRRMAHVANVRAMLPPAAPQAQPLADAHPAGWATALIETALKALPYLSAACIAGVAAWAFWPDHARPDPTMDEFHPWRSYKAAFLEGPLETMPVIDDHATGFSHGAWPIDDMRVRDRTDTLPVVVQYSCLTVSEDSEELLYIPERETYHFAILAHNAPYFVPGVSGAMLYAMVVRRKLKQTPLEAWAALNDIPLAEALEHHTQAWSALELQVLCAFRDHPLSGWEGDHMDDYLEIRSRWLEHLPQHNKVKLTNIDERMHTGHHNVQSLPVVTNEKRNEKLFKRVPCDGGFKMDPVPRAIDAVDPLCVCATGPFIYEATRRFKEHFRLHYIGDTPYLPIPLNYCGSRVHVIFGPMLDAELATIVTLAANTPCIVLLIAGDDSLILWNNGRRCVALEGDYAMYDASQIGAALQTELNLYRWIGVPKRIVRLLSGIARAPNVVRDRRSGHTVFIRNLQGARRTGGTNTTIGGSLLNMCVLLEAIHRIGDDVYTASTNEVTQVFSDVALEMGFSLKSRVFQETHVHAFQGTTFLKHVMLVAAIDGSFPIIPATVFIAMPLPSRLLKIGTSLRDPRAIYASSRGVPTHLQAARFFLRDQAAGLRDAWLDGPLEAFCDRFYEAGAVKPFDREDEYRVAHAARDTLYFGAPKWQWRAYDFTDWFLTHYGEVTHTGLLEIIDLVHTCPVPGIMFHPLFERMARRDYA